MGPRLERLAAWAAPAAAVGLALWAFVVRYGFLTQSPYPLGIDGYFYPVQLRALLETGALHYPSSPLALWLMAPLAQLTDPITGAKLGAALGTAAAAVPFYFLGARLGGDRVLGLLAAVLVATSAQSFYLASEFVKSGIGFTVAAVYLCALARAFDPPSGQLSRRRLLLAAAALLAVLATHKQAFAFAAVATVPLLIAHALARGWRPSVADRATRLGLLAAAAAVAILALFGMTMPERFIAGRDLAQLGGLFTARADYTLPALALPGAPPLRFGYETALAGGLGLAALVLYVRGDRSRAGALVIGPALVALVVALPWIDVSDPQGLGFRLRLVSFASLALCATYVAGRALKSISPLVRAAVILGFAVGWLMSRPATSTEGTVTVEPHMAAAIMAADGVVPDDHVIVTPQRSLVFMITWYTGNRATLDPHAVDPNRRWRLLPSRLMHPELRRAIEHPRAGRPAGVPPVRGLHPRSPSGVVLMPEATWRWLLEQLSPAARRAHEGWSTI